VRKVALLASLALGVLVASLAAEAQQAEKVYRLGILSPAPPPVLSDRGSLSVLLPTALRELGYAEGRNLLVERRFAEGKHDRLPGLARELVQLRVDVIATVGNDATQAAKDATKTIPIVMMGRSAVERGYVASLARPGGNITGVVIAETALADKRLELLKEAVPGATRIAALASGEEDKKTQLREAEKAAAALRVTLVVTEVRGGDYERAFANIVAGRAGALLVLSSPVLFRDRKQIIALAAKHRLPAIYQWREHAEDGGLMAYGSNLPGLSRRVAAYVDRILKGANPAQLPVEQPTVYELVINLKTAKALGLTIPQSVLVRADELLQ
jgi:putative ABC transport system substrate-binding protein